jgi:arginine:pyruvate transaminase
VRLSSLTGRIQVDGSESWRVHTLASERLRAGDDVIVLSIGDPDFPPPPHVVDAVERSIRRGRTHYTPARGEPQLLAAIAARADVAAGRVVFLPGAQAALYAALMCIAEPGDEVIVTEPAYATYDGVVASTGARMVLAPLRPEHDFHLDPADVIPLVTDRTRAIVINTPHNPSGAVMPAETLDALAAICRDADLWLVSDEVYADLVFAGAHASALDVEGAEERVVVLSSLSKSHAMTGFRHGWLIGPEELCGHISRLLESMLFGSPPFVQDAGLAALTGPQDATAAMRDAYHARAQVVLDGLAGVPGVSCHPPEAGMFVLVDVRGTGMSGAEFALRLLDAAAVAVTPTDTFGPSGAGHVRIALTASEDVLAEACRRIAAFSARRGTASPTSSP